ncbi:hypothetical protein [Isoptericola sp. 178]|uniref:hypothetical protein n=1 Tax=Isoptericola sp. 178 TaxID=3064651 RepID=UPI0027131F86|nr:hypothetical protein [Isoptericola sp. 178]MDO8143621.1 hypothetical protein [Isoptericola sp. 178]
MDVLQVPSENRRLVHAVVPDGDAEFWIPLKSAYIAVRPTGERTIRYFVNRRFVDHHVGPSRYERTEFVEGEAVGPFQR